MAAVHRNLRMENQLIVDLIYTFLVRVRAFALGAKLNSPPNNLLGLLLWTFKLLVWLTLLCLTHCVAQILDKLASQHNAGSGSLPSKASKHMQGH